MTLKHTYVSAIADSGDPTVVQPSDWNANHVVSASGILKGSAGDIVAATAGSDYVDPATTVNGKALTGNITLGLASADFANQGTTTTVLHGNAAGNPSFGAVALATDVSGILTVTNGGTGASTLTSGSLIIGNGSGAVTFIDPGTAGGVLTSDGSVWANQGQWGKSLAAEWTWALP